MDRRPHRVRYLARVPGFVRVTLPVWETVRAAVRRAWSRSKPVQAARRNQAYRQAQGPDELFSFQGGQVYWAPIGTDPNDPDGWTALGHMGDNEGGHDA